MTYGIKVENLGKKYFVRNTHSSLRHRSLRDDIMAWVRQLPNLSGKSSHEFWALKDVGFEVQPGDKLGIIGRNGAGKSTLLKLLSRVTEPTTGAIRLRGRVSSLLEVGTGFHPELTGRENIYLNGVILGMTKSEIRQKFDEIVEFAGVRDFLGLQVKHYSSGMYMRLAFSVAAHLDPEILIIDEVLAVGDADFQKKCIGKMQDISKGGRTVIFVSHNMQTITSLCNKALLLEKGQVKRQGIPSEVIVEYLGGSQHIAGRIDFHSSEKPIGDKNVELLFGEVFNHNGLASIEIDIRAPLSVRMGFRVLSRSSIRYIPNFHFVVPGGVYAFVSSPAIPCCLPPGDYVATCEIPGNFLNEGTYFVGLAISSFEPGLDIHFFEASAISFNVKDSMEGNTGRHGYVNVMPGVVRPHLNWTVKDIQH